MKPISFFWDITIRANWTCPAHRHTCTELVYVKKARGKLYQDGRVYDYCDGSLIVYQPAETHWVDNQIAGTHYCLGIEASEIPAGVHTATPEVRDAFLSLSHYFRKQGIHVERQLSLLSELIRITVSSDLEHFPEQRPAGRAEQIRRFIDHHLAEPLSVSELANYIAVHPDYLRRIFREAFGISIGQYIRKRRLERAAELLSHTSDKVREIGRYVGIENEFHFSRQFKKHFGLSPAKYRNQDPK